MRLVAILAVMAIIGMLASRQLTDHHSATGTAPAAQGVVNDARSAITHVQDEQQAQQDAQAQPYSQP